MPDLAETAGERFDRDDIELVKVFLTRYKDQEGSSYHLKERPDNVEREAKAVDAVAVDQQGHRLAIEHTMLEAFAGKRRDDVRFLAAFEHLRFDESLRLPNRLIDVLCPALAIPRGVNWRDVGQKVLKWFKEARRTFAVDGESWYTIPDVGFDLKVCVQTMEIPGTDGVVAVGRILPADRPFIDVLQKALRRKVPKLVGTPADKRILLLEDEGIATGFSKVIQGIESSQEKLPELKAVDEVWLVKTMGWKASGALYFLRVWPGGVTERFRILDSRFTDQKPRTDGHG